MTCKYATLHIARIRRILPLIDCSKAYNRHWVCCNVNIFLVITHSSFIHGIFTPRFPSSIATFPFSILLIKSRSLLSSPRSHHLFFLSHRTSLERFYIPNEDRNEHGIWSLLKQYRKGNRLAVGNPHAYNLHPYVLVMYT